MRRIALISGCLAGAALMLLGIAGCGSDPDPEVTTKAEFVERANEICNRANEVLRQGVVDAFGPDEQPSDEEGIRYTHEVWVPNLRQQVRDLRALEWPPGDRREIESMLKGLERATDRVEADPGLASQGPFEAVTRRLTDYGIGPCGSP
ncbi:MAG: hypothetical protein J0H98_02115 [Solirubrobacterales bacterium]|nr:hypothetical protein [Solirubrobacterales bacterium]